MSNTDPKKNTKEDAIAFSRLVYDNIELNIKLVHPIYDTTNEYDKFFYGIISRQLSFVTDISCLLQNQFVNNLTSIFILGRAIIDDFMPLHYICENDNTNDEITNLNADAHNKAYKKLKDLADLNESILNGEFPYYPTTNSLKELETSLLENIDKDKYFIDKSKMKFKRFHNKRTLIDTYEGKDSHADIYRVYFRWRKLSDYVHYSKFSYDFNIQNNTIEYQYNDLIELFLYAYYGCKLVMQQFENKYDIEHITSSKIENLNVHYLTTINKI